MPPSDDHGLVYELYRIIIMAKNSDIGHRRAAEVIVEIRSRAEWSPRGEDDDKLGYDTDRDDTNAMSSAPEVQAANVAVEREDVSLQMIGRLRHEVKKRSAEGYIFGGSLCEEDYETLQVTIERPRTGLEHSSRHT